jgi:hypothetical protein
VLTHLARHGTVATRTAVAACPRLPAAAAAALATSKAPTLRATLLGRDDLDAHTAVTALAGPLSDAVAAAALTCDALTGGDLDRVLAWLSTPRTRDANQMLSRTRTLADLADHARARRLLLTRVDLPAAALVALLDAEQDDDVAATAVALLGGRITTSAERSVVTTAARGQTTGDISPAGRRTVARRARRFAPVFRIWQQRHPGDCRNATAWEQLVGHDRTLGELHAAEVRGETGMARHGAAVAAELTARFGDDIVAWQTATTLLAGWDGPVADALDAAADLAGTA